ncbi:uncharacterized protein LOC133833014 [Humulus lupulus]|uniref:uncharacterized protein LOC133833014 n=1 Tax=Humulus lupulus TaxID=3486 RepID=UPI002B409521|nr:uncharacterized protein LOC133833014 [Humulus lupulus]
MAKKMKPIPNGEGGVDNPDELDRQFDEITGAEGTGSQCFATVQNGMEDSSQLKASWTDATGEDDFQASAQKQWQSFTAKTLSFSEQKLEFTEPEYREGRKFSRIDIEEVKVQLANWTSAVICMVLGANPPMAVFEGFIKRIWGHLGIAQIARMTMGLTMVKFNDEATRDNVLENGIIHFDRKPVIIRPWTTDLSAVCLVRSVLLWIRLQDLGLQYWGSKCLSALVSTIGKPIMVDKYTRVRSRIQFARVLVEMEVTDNPPTSIEFINEHGQIMEQGVDYEWLPTKCKNCSSIGHAMTDCRKIKNAQWVMKEAKINKDETGQSSDGPKAVELEGTEINADTEVAVDQINSEGNKKQNDLGVSLPDKEGSTGFRDSDQSSQPWQTLKKVDAPSKEGQISVTKAKVTGQKNKSLNKFVVLQEDRLNGVGGLLETKLKGSNISRFVDLHFLNWDYYTSPEIEGRLLIVWRKSFVKHRFGVTFVYGMNSIEGRRSLWDGLRRPFLKDTAWIYLGDFNAPFTGKDRSGGKPISGLELADPNRWLVDAYLEPLKSVGSYFTWTNNLHGAARIHTKIDHVLINEKWVHEKLGVRIFRFCNYWIEHQDFHTQVLRSWNQPINATRIQAIYLKMLRLKHCLKAFNTDKIGDLKANFYKAKETFQAARLQAQSFPHVLDFQEVEKEEAEAYSVQEKLYQSFLIQRSKITWLRQGDLNTSFYYAFLKKRKADNGIISFLTEDGKVVDNFSDVVSHFMGYFREFLGSSSSASGSINDQIVKMGPQLSVSQKMKLLKPFSRKEIRESLFSIPITKSPGPDGFGSGFYKAVWNDIGDEVCGAITHCFESGTFPSELHEITLSLIPKVANPSRAIDYRSIACCSTLYKCMAKLICKRLGDILPDIIQPNQGAFVKGRSIAHNIMIFQDLIKNYGRATTSSRCAIKIDLRKAYDSVDWGFIENLLKALKFPMKFIGWIMACVRNTSYFLLMNGRIQGKFKGGKGLRQGDPMSPLLFVIIMEYLTRSLQQAAQNSPFRYHPMCKGLKLINLCFADDLLLFCKGSLAAIRVVKEVLDSFATATGLTINSDKSLVFFGGVSITDRTIIAHELNLTEGLFPLTYLGVPMRPTKWRHEDCEIILQKFCLKIQNWASRHLSFAGKIQLINSVLLGLRNYWMYIFILPQSIVKEIERICRGFLWGSAGQRSKLHVPSWQKVCLPKAYGGLGFRDGAKWNRAVLAKYVWALSVKPDLLWVKWIHSIYLKGVNFWNYVLIADCSWYWRKLCHLRNHFRAADITSAGVQGRFKSVKLYNSLLVQQKYEFYRTIWSRIVLPNHRFMLWQIVNSHLLTRDNLSRMQVQLTSEFCPVCDRFKENHSHLFFDCSFSSQLVKYIFDWLGFDAWPLDYQSWLVWLARTRKGVTAEIVNLVCAAVTYSIWKNRNTCFYEGYSSSILKLTQDIKFTTKYRLNIPSKRLAPVKDQLYIRHIQCRVFDSHLSDQLYCAFVQ